VASRCEPRSATRRRRAHDNALAETINGLYKAEVIHRRGLWRSFEAVEFANLESVDWFKNRRLMEPIGNTASRGQRAPLCHSQ
jgi:transposase InsO family protein